MAKQGKFIVYREPDGQYTLLVFSKASPESPEIMDSATSNLTLAGAFNSGRDALAAMATGQELHYGPITCVTPRIEV